MRRLQQLCRDAERSGKAEIYKVASPSQPSPSQPPVHSQGDLRGEEPQGRHGELLLPPQTHRVSRVYWRPSNLRYSDDERPREEVKKTNDKNLRNCHLQILHFILMVTQKSHLKLLLLNFISIF